MHPCPECGCHVHRTDRSCPHCGTRITTVTFPQTAAAALLGLTMACSGSKDGATTDSGTPVTSPEPEYGVTMSDIVADADTDVDADADSDADTDSGGSGTTYDSGTTGVDYGVTPTGGSSSGSGSTPSGRP